MASGTGSVQASIAFGPVPSRRLGRSLGINNIPPKHCSYSCLYCQVGPTAARELARREFLPPQQVVGDVVRRVEACRATGQPIDYLTFVPDGEPTLDLHLGRELSDLSALGLPRAVITNGSLLWRADVRAELAAAELVSVKVDAGESTTWRRINRPAGGLRFERVRAGLLDFVRAYPGRLITETMLVAGLNDSAAAVAATAELLERLAPARSYLAVPTRPPADSGVRAPAPAELVQAHEILSSRLPAVELLTAPEQGAFGRTGDAVEDLLAILAVHPMRESAARDYLAAAGAEPGALGDLIAGDRLVRVEYLGACFVARPWASSDPQETAGRTGGRR